MNAEQEWPKTVAVCLECGAVADTAWSLRETGPCPAADNEGHHGPTQNISVVPASSLTGLVEALAEAVLAEEGWEDYVSDYFREKWNFEGRRSKLRATLAKHQPTEGEQP